MKEVLGSPVVHPLNFTSEDTETQKRSIIQLRSLTLSATELGQKLWHQMNSYNTKGSSTSNSTACVREPEKFRWDDLKGPASSNILRSFFQSKITLIILFKSKNFKNRKERRCIKPLPKEESYIHYRSCCRRPQILHTGKAWCGTHCDHLFKNSIHRPGAYEMFTDLN